jgi:hypothetical protein
MADKSVENRLERIEQTLQDLVRGMRGKQDKPVVRIRTAPPDDTQRADYIELGSDKHRAWLGIEVVESVEVARKQGFNVTYESPKTGKTYRLMDELSGFENRPDPEKAALNVLRQKVSSLESGPPQVPADAPPLWTPGLDADALSRIGAPPGAIVIRDAEDDAPIGSVGYGVF